MQNDLLSATTIVKALGNNTVYFFHDKQASLYQMETALEFFCWLIIWAELRTGCPRQNETHADGFWSMSASQK